MAMAMTTTTPSQSHSQPLPVILLLFLLLSAAIPHLILEAAAAEQDEQQPITLADCPNKCGNMSIPYPFGMKRGCFREGFQVTCNYSFDHPRAYLANSEQRTQQFYDSVKVSCFSVLAKTEVGSMEHASYESLYYKSTIGALVGVVLMGLLCGN